MSGWLVDVMQTIRLASKDLMELTKPNIFGTIIKKTLYRIYYPLLKIIHEWYRLKYHSAQEAVFN